MPKLSVVILTKNEERNIKDCLESVHNWADEIIVLDDESSDKTVEIAARYGAKIIPRKMDNEGRQRNFGYAQAKNQWVLSLDADERVTPGLREEITAAISQRAMPACRQGRVRLPIAAAISQETPCNGFTIPRRNYIGDYWVRYGGWYPSPQLKLFRKDKFRYEEAGVHPRAFMDDPCGHLKADLLHYSYRDLSDFIAKMNNQTTREAQKWYSQNKPMRLGKFLWRTYDRFFRGYLGKKGWKDGYLGFVVAYFAGLYQFLSYLKYRELARANKCPRPIP